MKAFVANHHRAVVDVVRAGEVFNGSCGVPPVEGVIEEALALFAAVLMDVSIAMTIAQNRSSANLSAETS